MTRKLRQRILRALSLALVGAALAAGTAQAERPDASVDAALGEGAGITGTAPAWLQALEARSEALNKEHGLGDYSERHALRTPGPGWKEALMIRSDAMNRRAVARSIGGSARPDDRGDARGPGLYFSVPPVPTRLVPTDDFQWRDASAGAGAMILAIVLAAGVTVSIRQRGRAAVS